MMRTPRMARKRHSSPDSMSKDELTSESDDESDGENSSTEQTDDLGVIYSYMCPVSSDIEDEPQTPHYGVNHAGPRKHREIKITRSTKKPLSDIGLTESESDHEEAAAQNNRVAKAKTSLTGSRCWKGRLRKHQNRKASARRLSTDGDSETSDKLITEARLSPKTKDNRIAFPENGSDSGASEDGDGAKNRTRNNTEKVRRKRNVKEMPKALRRAKVTPEDSPSKPSVQNAEGQKGGPMECKVCGRDIRCKATMERHMRSHTGEKPFECGECGKRYTSGSNLRIHQLSHSGKMDHACNSCGQKFTHLSYLKRHLLIHSGEKAHVCDHCGKGFFRKYHLLRHVPVHTRRAARDCAKCGKSFNRTDYLKQHLRSVHQVESLAPTPERRFECETCSKSLCSLTALETHKRIHTGARRYKCVVCSRQFKQSSHLNSHMFTHAKEKPHPCDLCELKFSRKQYLEKHKERVHRHSGVAQNP